MVYLFPYVNNLQTEAFKFTRTVAAEKKKEKKTDKVLIQVQHTSSVRFGAMVDGVVRSSPNRTW